MRPRRHRPNPAPAGDWSEAIAYKQLTKRDRVRGGRQKVVQGLSWIDAPADAPEGTRATLYDLRREFTGMMFNERQLVTVFISFPVRREVDGWHGVGLPAFDVPLDTQGPTMLDDDALRAVGLHGYQIATLMLARLRELDPSARRRA